MIECRRETLLLGQQLAEHEVELRSLGIPLDRRRECADRLVQVVLLPPRGGTLVSIPERDGELITPLGVIRIRRDELAQPDERAIQIAGGSASGRGVGAGGRKAAGGDADVTPLSRTHPEHHALEVGVRIVPALLRVQSADAFEKLVGAIRLPAAPIGLRKDVSRRCILRLERHCPLEVVNRLRDVAALE